MLKKLKEISNSQKIIITMIAVIILCIIALVVYFITDSSKETVASFDNENLLNSNETSIYSNSEVNNNKIENGNISDNIASSSPTSNAQQNNNQSSATTSKNVQTLNTTNKQENFTGTTANNSSSKPNANNGNGNQNNNNQSSNNDTTSPTPSQPNMPEPTSPEEDTKYQKAMEELETAKYNYEVEKEKIENWYSSEVNAIDEEIASTTSKLRSLGGCATYADITVATQNLQAEKIKVSQAGLSNTGAGRKAIQAKENELANVRARYQYTQAIEELNSKKRGLNTQRLQKLSNVSAIYAQRVKEIREKYE